MSDRSRFARIYRIAITLLAWSAVIGSFVQRMLNRAPDVSIARSTLDFFSYFTIQTNLLVVIWLTLAVLYWRREPTPGILRPKIKGAITAYISVTFIIYALLLAPLWEPAGFDLYVAVITHYVTPIAFILDWFLFERRGTYQWRFILPWLIYPLCYLTYHQVYGSVTGRYMYPFLNLTELGAGGLAISIVALTAFFCVLSCIYIGVNRLLGRRKQP